MKMRGGKLQLIEPTIKQMAMDVAGVFYEQNRTKGFRAVFPTYKDYVEGRWHNSDGTVKRYVPGWQHHVDTARKLLVKMLRDKRVSEEMKERIAAAIIEDDGNSKRFGKKITQRVERGDDNEQQAREVGRTSRGYTGGKAN